MTAACGPSPQSVAKLLQHAAWTLEVAKLPSNSNVQTSLGTTDVAPYSFKCGPQTGSSSFCWEVDRTIEYQAYPSLARPESSY